MLHVTSYRFQNLRSEEGREMPPHLKNRDDINKMKVRQVAYIPLFRLFVHLFTLHNREDGVIV